jgi:hypothetical protein
MYVEQFTSHRHGKTVTSVQVSIGKSGGIMSPHNRLGIIAAFAVLAVVALLGWTRKSSNPNPAYAANGGAYSYNTPVTQPDVYGQPAQLAGYQGNPCVEPANYATPVLYAPDRYVRTVRQPPATVVRRQVVSQAPVESRSRVVRKRSLAKSAAIVGGSAGVGAAIGALAGGGKGAAIGALAGGAGGFVYDRMTHVKRE